MPDTNNFCPGLTSFIDHFGLGFDFEVEEYLNPIDIIASGVFVNHL
jgi:hypothetical protein